MAAIATVAVLTTAGCTTMEDDGTTRQAPGTDPQMYPASPTNPSTPSTTPRGDVGRPSDPSGGSTSGMGGTGSP